jgi:parvulin-like peptidyl-prolyl isomerase
MNYLGLNLLRRFVAQVRSGPRALLLGALCMTPHLAAATLSADEVFVRVNGEDVLASTYRAALRTGGRQRFYHGTPPEAEVIAFRKQIGEQLVDERLLHQEAVRLGIEPDSAWVEEELKRIVKRYQSTDQWQQEQKQLLPLLREGLEERSRIEQLQDRASTAHPPSDDELMSFYRANAEAFTSPEQVRVSMILLKVEPWAEAEVWDRRRREAEEIYGQLEQGADFDELARRYSDDESASEGGDMGYQHKGMLGSQAQTVIDKLRPGEMAAPEMLLEGIAIFSLEDRVEARLNSLEKVRARAEALWLREAKEKAYSDYIAALRTRAEVSFSDPAYYLTARK